MTDIANADQYDSWNGDSGLRWVASADRKDEVLAPVADAILRVAEPTAGERVLDVGCGCGATTLMAAAHVGDTGTVTGIDLSAPMLDLARQRAASAAADYVTFIHGDAQVHAFVPASVDAVLSRFGTMFFAEPVAAFTNVASALRPGGRCCIATWQPLAANDWLVVPGAALLEHTDLPADSTDGPGMFAQSDPNVIIDTLTAAGLTNVTVESVRVILTLGATIDDALAYLVDSGPGRQLLDTIPLGPARDAAIDDVRNILTECRTSAGVQLGAGIWLSTASRPATPVR